MKPRAGFEPAISALPIPDTNKTINNSLPQAIDIDMLSSVLAEAVKIALERLTGERVESGGRPVVWNSEVRETFVKHLTGRDPSYVKDLVSTLDRHMTEPIKSPRDVLDMFSRCGRGRDHLAKAFKILLKVYRIYYGLPRDRYEELKEAVPTVRVRADRHVPSEEEIVETFRKVRELPVEFQAVYNVVLESPSRPTHVVQVLKTWDERRLRKAKTGEFYIYEVNMVKRTKACFRLHITPETLELIREAVEGGFRINKDSFRVAYRRGLTRLKYVRKFAMNAMYSSGLTPDVIRLLAGERPKTVLEEHYIDVERMAEQQYPKYLAYLAQLRRRI